MARGIPLLMILLVLFFSFPVGAQALRSSETASSGFTGLPPKEMGELLLKHREAGEPDRFARDFKDWLDSGKSVREILALLRVTGRPFRDDEIAVLSDLIIDYSPAARDRNLVHHGYSLEAYSNNRVELVLLNKAEMDGYARALRLSELRGTTVAHFMTSDLEGRLCVWTGERKIFLGGGHFDFDRVARILCNPPTPEDLTLPPDTGEPQPPSLNATGSEPIKSAADAAFDSSF